MSKISIIVPIYNVEKYLERCVDSLINQTYRDIEIVLVDDGSPDGCPAMCDEFAKADPRIKVVHKQNGGVSSARNAGVDNATGDLIAFVDPDDYVEYDFLEFLYSLMTQNDADISACGVLEVYPSGKTSMQWDDKTLTVFDRREAMERMCYNEGFYITLWDKLYKRELFEGVRFPDGKLFEDTGTTYKIVHNANKIVMCHEPKYYYVMAPNSITTSKFKMSKLDYVEMADNMAEFINTHYDGLESATLRKQMHACFSTLTQLVNSRVRNKEVEKLLISRIKKSKKSMLCDPRTPSRDRFAIFALGFGFTAFSLMWRTYLKLKKG